MLSFACRPYGLQRMQISFPFIVLKLRYNICVRPDEDRRWHLQILNLLTVIEQQIR